MNSLTDPKFKAFDANGDPLSGGLLYTYEEGTTTPKTTYSDVALTSANANPIVLDSRGEASVYGSGTFKFVLKDSGGTTVWTVDSIFAASSVTDADGNLVVTSIDTGATIGPYLKLYRNSSSPADDDVLGGVLFEGKNDKLVAERISYAQINATATDVSDGTEDGKIIFYAMSAGTLTEVASITPAIVTLPGNLSVTGTVTIASVDGRRSASLNPVAGGTALVVADGVGYLLIPEALNGYNLVRANAVVITAGVTGATTIDIYNVTSAADMLSSAISIASTETVGTVGTIDTAEDDVATNDVLRVDVTSIATGTAPKGLVVILEFNKP